MAAPDPYAKVKVGDAFTGFPAAFYNDLQDMLRWWKTSNEGGSGSTGLTIGEEARTIVPVKNASGADIDRFAILGISDFLFSPTDNSTHFKNRPCLKGVSPTAGDAGRFIITQAPIGSGRVGPGMLLGVSAVQIDVIDATDDFADCITSDTTKLRSQPYGPCQILYKQSGTGTKWAYVAHGTAGMQLLLGKTNASHAKGASGTINVYRGTTAGSEAATGSTTVTAWNHFADVASGKWVLCAWLQRNWKLVAAEC